MTNITKKSISEIIDTDLLDYSMYVLQNRAIPSAIDGFKSSGRKLVYAMLNDYPTRKVKVAELAGSIAKYGFHHGESSAEGATVTLTADWNNNCPVFTGHGNFGSRLIQEAAASRYIFVSLSPEFKKYFIDTEVAPKSDNEENPEPVHYLPIVPWVLINSLQGIAVGFACNILPRSIADIIFATKFCIKSQDRFLKINKPIPPTFPHFKGTVAQESEDALSWSTTGIIKYIGKYTYQISELPVGYDREQYITILNNLCDSDKIKDYEDSCSEDGFGFSVKVSTAQKEKIDEDPIKFFKLKKNYTENITTLGIDGKLKIFNSINSLIAYFCEYRLKKFGDKIEYEKESISLQLKELSAKIKFITDIINEKIDFRKTTKSALLEYISDNITKEDFGKSFVNISVINCTTDVLETLQNKLKTLSANYTVLENTTPLIRYLEVLK